MRIEYSGILIPHFVNSITREFDYINSQLSDENRRPGGIFSVFLDKPSRAPLLVLTVRNPLPEKGKQSFDFSLEKGRRLIEHPDHLSSWQSRDPDNSKWGGAIRVGEFILSFSGLPELVDEALMLNLVYPNKLPRLELHDEVPEYQYLLRVASFSKNPFFR